MRLYFAVLFILFAILISVSYKISTTFHSDASPQPASLGSNLNYDDKETSDCFEKRYSPQIRQCGGLLKYGYPSFAYAGYESSTKQPSMKGPGKRRLAANERQGKTGSRLAKRLRPSTPPHSAVATFEPTW
jgi:hypothetical protein